jgi:poly-gamma-glutamate synthesis protein (capsule biosynthesis protein)
MADLARVTTAVDALRVLAHWGTQYTYDTVRDQRVVARALADAGADVVIGGHPHWVQGVELHPVDSRPRSLIAYSLGNYVFDMDFSRQTEEGVILELVFWGPRLMAVELVPVLIGPDFAPRLARGAAGAAILDRVWQAGGPPLSGSHRVP